MELPTTIEECHNIIHKLLQENAALRQSGASFGRLAERLNSELQQQRRLGRERRSPRPAGDGRQTEPAMAGHETPTR